MTHLAQRVRRLEARRRVKLLAALDAEWATFRALYGGTSDKGKAVFFQVLEPFSEAEIEAFNTAVEVLRTGGGSARLNMPILAAVIDAFRRHNAGALL